MNVEFTQKLTEWQDDLFGALDISYHTGKTYVVKSSRQKGKSFSICAAALKLGLTYSGTILIVEPTNKQNLRLYKILEKSIAGTPLCRSHNASIMDIELVNGTTISFRSAESKESLRGYVVTIALFVDEAAYVQQDVFEILLQCTNVNRAPSVLLSTPAFAQGFFFEQYTRGLDPYEKMVLSFDWTDTTKYDFSEFISQEQIDYYKRIYSKAKFTTEVLGEFIKDKSFIFGEYDRCIKDPANKVPVFCGIDWGSGQGQDDTVAVFMNAQGQMTSMFIDNQLDAVALTDKLADIINSQPQLQTVLVEHNSIGKIYYDLLRSKLRNKNVIREFTTSNDSKREIIEALVAGFGENNITIIDDIKLKQELSIYNMELTKSGQITYNAPLGFHDDCVIALALAYKAYNMRGTGGSMGFQRRR